MLENLVSICIPTYNGEQYLQEALDSVRKQTYQNIEVVISDDNSGDDTLEICRKFKEEVAFPVRIYGHTPSGIGDNWNNCIHHANGEYIKFLFQDDVLEATCLETQLRDLRLSGLKAACSGRTIIDSNSELSKDNDWVHRYGDLQAYLNLGSDIKSFVFTKWLLNKNTDYAYNIFGEPDTFLFHRSVFEKVGLFNNNMKQIIDLEFGYRILKKYNILIERAKLLKFRVHEEQASSTNHGQEFSEFGELTEWVKKEFFWYLSLKEKLRFIKRAILR